MIAINVFVLFFIFKNFAGFNKLSLELAKYSRKIDKELDDVDGNGVDGWDNHNTAIDAKQLYNSIQQMFSSLADPNGDEIGLSMKEYIEYKKRYVKHFQFNPDIQNLSKFFKSLNTAVKVIHVQLL